MINTEAKFQNINTQLTQHGAQFFEISIVLRNVQTLIQALVNQVGQLARANAEHFSGSLLSNTKNKLRKHLTAINLRSEKQLEIRVEEDPSFKEDRLTIQEDPRPSKKVMEGKLRISKVRNPCNNNHQGYLNTSLPFLIWLN